MSKQQHDKQLARARSKRRDNRLDKRSTRNRVVIIVMVVLMGLSLIAVPLASLLSGDDAAAPEIDASDASDASDAEAAEEPAASGPGPCGEAPEDVPAITSEVYDAPFGQTIDPEAEYVATFVTTCGDIVIELDAQNAPEATNNLVNLAEDGYYDGVIFHRVVPQFVVQVGDPAGTGCGQEDCAVFAPSEPSFPGYTFGDELTTAQELYDEVRAETAEELRAALEAEGESLSEDDEALLDEVPGGYPRGAVAMANAGPDTNGSQFFIAQGDPTGLPGPDFTVLGTVVEGMEVVDDIAAAPTDDTSRPFEPVSILSVRIEQA